MKGSPDRYPPDAVERQRDTVMSRLPLTEVADSITDMVAVVNNRRQIVFANRVMLAFAGPGTEPCGPRPGELLGCVNAGKSPEGCGLSEACRLCGAGTAVSEVLERASPVRRECSLDTGNVIGGEHLFDVTATPFELDGERYVFLYYRDTGDSKRKNALQRVFFHDILNTASSLKVYIDLMKKSRDGKSFIGEIENITDSLVDEIRSQRMLVYAESGTLSVQENLIVSGEIADSVIRAFALDRLAEGKEIVLAPFSESFGFVSDEALVHRILMNMVKNALEASGKGDTVTIGYSILDGRVLFSVHNPGAMTEGTAARVFTRYFSTKGENRGLGTYGMRLLAEGYLRGKVSFSSTEAEGTTFVLTLPFRQPGSIFSSQ